MFTEALNAPWLLIILYLLPLCATLTLLWRWLNRYDVVYKAELWQIFLSALLLGAGLALLGAAYLHDVWYC